MSLNSYLDVYILSAPYEMFGGQLKFPYRVDLLVCCRKEWVPGAAAPTRIVHRGLR